MNKPGNMPVDTSTRWLAAAMSLLFPMFGAMLLRCDAAVLAIAVASIFCSAISVIKRELYWRRVRRYLQTVCTLFVLCLFAGGCEREHFSAEVKFPSNLASGKDIDSINKRLDVITDYVSREVNSQRFTDPPHEPTPADCCGHEIGIDLEDGKFVGLSHPENMSKPVIAKLLRQIAAKYELPDQFSDPSPEAGESHSILAERHINPAPE